MNNLTVSYINTLNDLQKRLDNYFMVVGWFPNTIYYNPANCPGLKAFGPGNTFTSFNGIPVQPILSGLREFLGNLDEETKLHKLTITCECGSDAVKSPMHAHYCPKSSPMSNTSTSNTNDAGNKA